VSSKSRAEISVTIKNLSVEDLTSYFWIVNTMKIDKINQNRLNLVLSKMIKKTGENWSLLKVQSDRTGKSVVLVPSVTQIRLKKTLDPDSGLTKKKKIGFEPGPGLEAPVAL
jgi:hypothetical protein